MTIHATDDIIAKEGEKPFNFSFFDPEEKKYELHEILGKKNIVIYFYPKDFIPGSIQAGEFTENYEKFKHNEIEIIGISPDSEESHLKFRKKMKIPYMLASDKNNVISKKIWCVWIFKKIHGKGILRCKQVNLFG